MTLHLENRLLKREKLGNLRNLKLGLPLIDFSSNDYLGLARSSKLTQAILLEWERHSPLNRFGSTGSRLLTGNSWYAQSLEDSIAKFHGFDTGVLFNCGYMANVGLLATIGSQSIIFYDSSVHASTHDGIRLSRAKAFPFKHNHLEHLENRLKHCSFSGERFICVESVYSTDGSIAPLIDICKLAHKYGAHLIVDEAHAVGVFGPNGRGLVAESNLSASVFAEIVTFGKALGTFGAIVLGNHILKKALINFANAYIYTTSLPFQMLAAIKCSYDLFPEMEEERENLQKLIHLFGASEANASATHIKPIFIQGNENAKKASCALAAIGFDIRPLLSPTVQRGHELLRVCLHAFNTRKELALLLKHIETYRSPPHA